MCVATPDSPDESRRRWHWLAERRLAFAAVIVALPFAVITILGTLSWWPGRTFPGFFVMGNAIVPTIGVPDWTGMGGVVPFHAQVVEVDGRRVTTSRDVYDYVAQLPVGTPVRYSLRKEDTMSSRIVSTMRFTPSHYWLTVGLFLAFGVLSTAAGVGVVLLQPRTEAARAFLVQGFLVGLLALTAPALYQPDLWWLSRLHFATHATFPAAFIHLGLVFPEPRPLVARHPRWIGAPYIVSLLLTAWLMVSVYGSPPSMTAYYVTCLYVALAIVALVGLVAYAYWENRTPSVRPRLHAVLPGLILGTVLALYGFVNISRSGGNFPINLIALAPPLFYLSVAYAIVKHDLFDIDALVKQAAVYGTLTLAVTAAYAVSLAVLSMFVPASQTQVPASFTVAFIVLVGVLFQPLRTGAQTVIDRTFYRSRLDYRRTVSELSAALTSLLDLEEILSRVGRTVTEGLQLRSLAAALWLDGDGTLWRYDQRRRRMEPGTPYTGAALQRELDRGAGRPWYPGRERRPNEDGPDGTLARQEATQLGAALVVPLAIHGRTIGALALSPRRSGRPFSGEDIELLATFAAQSAVAVQNAHSYRVLQAVNEGLEAKVRARTAELEASSAELAASNVELGRAYEELQAAQAQLLITEKMASLGLIVAGVAHEINNPLSFIVGNVEPLHDTLAQLQTLAAKHGDAHLTAEMERLAKILDLMALGAERTAAIVQDLRTFSRLGEEQPRPTDLHEAIEVSLRLLRPRWAERIAIHRHYGALAPIEVIPGQINQVFMNVLANACDAIPGSGNLWISTTYEGAHVVIAVRDDGSGIPPEHVTRVFDPFFTTKPVGQGTGLGLAITQGIVTAHGGTIRVTTEPGKGTEFRIILPRDGLRSVSDGSS